MPWWSRPLLTATAIAVVALAWWLASRVRPGSEDAAQEGYAPLLAVLGLIVFSPIISPQYVLWLVPFAAILAVRRDWWVAGLTFVIAGISTFQLATIKAQIEGTLWATIPIVVRNGLLVALGAVCLARLLGLARRGPTAPSPVR